MTYKEAWCKIVSEISNTYDEEIKEALFMLAVAANMADATLHLSEKLNEIENKPISILDKDAWNVNVLKQSKEMKFEEQELK